MSGTGELLVDLSGPWLELPVRGAVEPGAWAAEVVPALLEERVEPELVTSVLAATWARVLAGLRARADEPGLQLLGAFALLDDEGLVPVTVAEVTLLLREPHQLGRGLDAVVEDLVLPVARRFAPPDVAELATAAGPAVRLRQLAVVTERAEDHPLGPGDEEVQTSVSYLWQGPAEDVVLVLSAWFGSSVEAELTLPLLDQAARTVRLQA